MTEQDLLNLKINETIKTENGERYTRTIGGWIYSNFSGQLLFIPEVKPAEVKTEKVKAVTNGLKKGK